MPLQKGDKIAIVSPSGATDPVFIDGAATVIKNWGFDPVIFPYAKNKYGRYGGTPEERIHDMQQAINDSSIKAILCSRGGYGAVQIVDKIDFTPMLQQPKWLIGFSDITVFHAVLSGMRIPSIHGGMARHLTENGHDSFPAVELHKILIGEKLAYTVPAHILNRTGVAKGTLIGGNLSVLYGLRGTKYDIKPKGKILVIEDLAEKPYHIDRIMNNLKMGGILEKLSGLVVGQFTEMDEDESMFKTVYEIIADAVSDYDYPVCFNFPAGHTDENVPLILGTKVTLKVDTLVNLEFRI